MTNNFLLYKIAQHAVFTWDLKLQDRYIEALAKAVRIMDDYELAEAMEAEG